MCSNCKRYETCAEGGQRCVESFNTVTQETEKSKFNR